MNQFLVTFKTVTVQAVYDLFKLPVFIFITGFGFSDVGLIEYTQR